MEGGVNLLDLPDELLIRIFFYLCPKDLVSIAKLDGRCERLTCDRSVVRKTDFTNARMTKEDFKLFFIPQRTENILDLNIGNHTNSVNLKGWIVYIKKCKFIQSLHVLSWKFTVSELTEVFSHLPFLKELSWAFFAICDKQRTKESGILNFKQLHKLRVFFPDYMRHYILIAKFLTYCSNLEYLYIGLLKSSSSSVYLNDENIFNFTKTKLCNVILQEYRYFSSNTGIGVSENITFKYQFMMELLASKNCDIKWKKLWTVPEIDTLEMKREYLKNVSNADTLLISGKYIDNHIKTDVLQNLSGAYHIGLNDLHISEVDFHNLSRLGKEGLHYLCMNNVTFEQQNFSSLSSELGTLFMSSQHLRELNILNTHFDSSDEIIKNISCLKVLEKIAIPFCALVPDDKKSSETIEDSELHSLSKRIRISRQSQNTMPLLLPLVQNCQRITQFEIHGCPTNVDSRCCAAKLCKTCTDNDLSPISELSNLRSLTLANLSFVRQAEFLELIAKSCKNFRKLCMHNVGNQSVWTYEASFCFLLKNASCLIDISLHHRRLNLNSENFLTSLAQAKNLQQICLNTSLLMSVNAENIVSSIRQLPHLTSFHFHSIPEFNYNKLKRCLNRLNKGKSGHKLELILEPADMNGRYFAVTDHPFYNCYDNNFLELCTLSTSIAHPKW